VRLTFTDPLFIFSLHQDDGTTSLARHPHIRVKNKGRRRCTSATACGDHHHRRATGGFISESVSYLDSA